MPPDTDPYFTPDPSPARRSGQNYDDIINRHAQRTGLDPALIKAVMGQESSGNARAVSPKGARGLLQLMPATAQRFGVRDVNDPEENIRGGADYLKFLHDRFKGDTDKILAGYNAGEGAVDKYKGIPPYKETQNYVPAVKARYQRLTSRPFEQLQQPQADPYFTPDSSTSTQKPARRQRQPAPKSPFAGVSAGAEGVKPFGRIRSGMQGDEIPSVVRIQPKPSRPFASNPLIVADRNGSEKPNDDVLMEQATKNVSALTFSPTANVKSLVRMVAQGKERGFEADVQEEFQRLKSQQERANSPEMIAARKRIGSIPANLPGPVPGAGRGAVSALQRIAGEGLKTVGGLVDPSFDVMGIRPLLQKIGVPLDKARDYLNARGDVLVESASMPMTAEGKEIERQLPEKATDAVTGLGLSLAQLILLKKATGLNLGPLMAIETTLKNSDSKPVDRAGAAAEAYTMGRLLDQHLSRPVSALAFGAPTAVQSGTAYSQGQKTLEDALLETGVQTVAGAALGGKEMPRPESLTRIPDIEGTLAQREASVSSPLQPKDVARRVDLRESGTVPPAVQPETPANIQPVVRGKPTPRKGEVPVVPDRPISEDVGVGVLPASGDIMQANAKIESLKRRIAQTELIKNPTRRTAVMRRSLEAQLSEATNARNSLLDTKVQAQLEGRPLADVLAERKTNATQTEAQPNVTAQPESAQSNELQARSRVAESNERDSVVSELVSQSASTPRHVDLLPRRTRNTESGKAGQFKKETRVQREARLAQVNAPSETKVEPTERLQPQESKPINPTPSTTFEAEGANLHPETTAARQASMQADRADLDLPELPQAERKSWQTSLANAKPERASLLADEVLSKPRSLNDEETASLVVRAQEIKNEHAQTMKEIGASSDPETIAAKKAQADALEREFDKITRATKASGTEKGRTLAAQKLTINKDYDLVSLIQRAKAVKGRDLTADERTRYEKMASQIEDLNKQLSVANEKAQTAQLERQIGKIQRQTRRQETKVVLDTEFASLKSQLAQAKLETRSGVQGSLLAGLDPEGKLTPIIAKMAKNRVKAGINSAEALVDEVFSAVKDHYDVSRDDIAKLIRGTLHQPDDVLSKWDKRRQSQLLKQQGGIESRLATGDFSPKPSRETPIYNRETFRLQRQVNDLKAKYDRDLYRATRGITGKIIDTAAGFGNIPKTMLSMADVSAVLRQGGIGVYQHPVLSSKAGVDMLKSFTSHGFANVENAIKNSPRFDQAKRSGVEFTGVDKDNPQLSKHEEGYLGSGAIDTLSQGKLNPLRVVKGVKDFSERTFVSFLDSQRMRIFENQAQALEGMGLKGKALDDALKSQAKYINIITGRGSLGLRGNQAAPALNVAMFSPRLIASRFQFLNKMLNPVAWANMPKGARKLQMVDNAKFLFGVASTLALAKAAGANVNLDPDDSEFLKIKVGNTRYDTLAGLQQPMRFMYRMTRAIKGGETYEGEDKGKIALDFARSKAAPLAGYGWDFLEDKNRLSGKKFEAGKDLVRNVIPLPFQDFQEAIKQDGAVRGIAETFPGLFGVGVQTYPASPEKATTKAEKLTRKLIAQKMPDEGRTQEEIDKDQKLSELRVQARRGIDVSKALEALKGSGAITDRTEKSILSARGQTRLQEGFKRLGLKEALTVYSTMTPTEQNSVKKILGEKAVGVDVLPLEDQKDVKAKLERYGFKPGMQIPKRPTVQRPERPNPRAWSAP